jgi:hypothetical protein
MKLMFDEEKLVPMSKGFPASEYDSLPPTTPERAEAKSKWLYEDSAPLRNAIKATGWPYSDDIWKIRNRNPADYESLFPVLVEHLMRPYYPMNLEGIVRALTLRSARSIAWDPLRRRLQEIRNDLVHPGDPYYRNCCLSLREAILNALAEMALKTDLDLLLEMLQDEQFGNGRVLLIKAFRRFVDPRVIPVLRKIRGQGKMANECDALLKLKKYQSLLSASSS